MSEQTIDRVPERGVGGAQDAGPGLRVTVVVTTHNVGPSFDDLVRSLEEQTLPTDQLEVLLCDDGSSEEHTQQRLTELEARHPHFRALRLAHSGWPGGPRNAGVAEARGRYIYFCDDDDRLHPEALERLCDFADEHGSDVVLGMMVGVGRWLNMRTFRRSIPHARLGVDPLLDFLTPHKLFRTSFVQGHAIAYPVGKVRLEDHQFVMQAYLEATTISIYADTPVYYWTVRTDRKSISSSRIDPAPYFRDMTAVLEIVERHTNPSPYRDSLLQHWYRGKVLGRLGGGRVVRYPREHLDNLIAATRPLLDRWFPPRIDALLPFPYRVRSALLRANDVDGLLALGEVEGGMKAPTLATSLAWTDDGRLRVGVTTSVLTGDNQPLRTEEVTHADGTAHQVWRSPAPVSPEVVTDEVLDVTGDLLDDSVQVFIRDLVDQSIYPLTDPLPTMSTEFLVDPATACFGRPISRRSELLLEIHRAGWVFRRRIRVNDDLLAPGQKLTTVSDGRELTLAQAPRENVLILSARRLPKPERTPTASRRVLDVLPPGAQRLAVGARRWARQRSSGPQGR